MPWQDAVMICREAKPVAVVVLVAGAFVVCM
jgi:hypothetical protein